MVPILYIYLPSGPHINFTKLVIHNLKKRGYTRVYRPYYVSYKYSLNKFVHVTACQ